MIGGLRVVVLDRFFPSNAYRQSSQQALFSYQHAALDSVGERSNRSTKDLRASVSDISIQRGPYVATSVRCIGKRRGPRTCTKQQLAPEAGLVAVPPPYKNNSSKPDEAPC